MTHTPGKLDLLEPKQSLEASMGPLVTATYRPPFRNAGKDCPYYPGSTLEQKPAVKRAIDINDMGDVWTYVPESHKMEHKDVDRVILLGPIAQEVLRPWLDRESDAYLFSPREVSEDTRARCRKRTGVVRTPVPHSTRKAKCSRMPRDHYDDETYCQAVERACKKAGVPKWTPGQLRHNAGTAIRRKYGLEAARLILGHRSASTTEIYAEKDMAEAARIVKDLG